MDLQFVCDRIRLLVVRFYPILFLLFAIGVWQFDLWSYLDYVFFLLVLCILGGVALNFNWSSIGSLLFGTNGYQKIHTRAKQGDSLWVKRYLERGGDPNVKAAGGVTPLYLATEAGHFDTVQILVEGRADVNQKLDDNYLMGFTPVFEAAYNRRNDIVEFLLKNGAEQDIFLSAALGDIEEIKRYAKEGGNLNVSRDRGTNKPYLSGKTLLHLATWRDSVSTVDFLLKNGAEIDIRDSNDRTPLHNAAARNSRNVALFLIEKGADVNAIDSENNTPLHTAATTNRSEMVKLLIVAGACINVQNFYGNTPLHLASRQGYVEVAEALVHNGADTTIPNEAGFTPLESAKHKGITEIIDLLQGYGAD